MSNASITTDDNDINITDTLQSGQSVENDGNLISNSNMGTYLSKNNNGTISNNTNRNILALVLYEIERVVVLPIKVFC